jgi:hypothetical protein
MLQRGTLWAATAQSFNDPFDCTTAILGDPDIEDRTTGAQQLEVFLGALKNDFTDRRRSRFGFNRTKVRQLIRELASASGPEAALSIFERALSRLPESFRPLRARDAINLLERKLAHVGIISLSARCDSLLMWSHYADSHRGFCLGFDREAIVSRAVCRPVSYCADLPCTVLHDINVTRVFSLDHRRNKHGPLIAAVPIDDPALLNVIYSKSQDWAYEQEWRILLLSGGNEIAYPTELREVVFGLRCSRQTRRAIVKVVQQSGATSVRFLQAVRVDSKFALAFGEEICRSVAG